MNSKVILDPTVDVLHELSNGGRVLEFAIGTGRVALPLSARGVSVVGIELSQPMLVSPDHAGIDEYDVVNQLLISHHYWIATGATFDSPHRYAWPAEYDLMASMAGLALLIAGPTGSASPSPT